MLSQVATPDPTVLFGYGYPQFFDGFVRQNPNGASKTQGFHPLRFRIYPDPGPLRAKIAEFEARCPWHK
jgi:hypothetical protein